MPIKRGQCRHCGSVMFYIFPSPHAVPAVDHVLSRLQECRQPGCKKQWDVSTGNRMYITRNQTVPGYTINGAVWPSIEAWMRSVGWID